MARVLVIITALMALTISTQADEATTWALQAWWLGLGPLPDLIARQDGLNQEIGLPLSTEELQTLREALWKREATNLRDRPDLYGQLSGPTVFQQMSFTHLLNGGALRAGDFTVLHGSLLTALQPNTFALAKKWQKIMDCVGPVEARAPRCKTVGY